MRTIRRLIVAALLLATACYLPAQGMDGGVTETLQSIYIPPLVGAPFTATIHTEWVRPLPGGGSITVVNERHVARDGRGRIYEERWLLVPKDTGVKSQMNVIQIADPNRHTLYNCFVFERRCTLLAEPAMSTFHPPVIPPGPIGENKGYATQLDLGARSIAGMETTGTRETTTLLPGTFGNDRPLVTTREFWQAAQIGVNVLSTLDDPRIGRQTFTLSDISLNEPDPQLFRLPQGYEILDRRRK